ncbi:MAG: carbohydrate ABC transporter permease, partial [Ruminococcaceae bacterium]|nr:carbohydrate ABC transporter permease [Oscillospiraceae bacterium]
MDNNNTNLIPEETVEAAVEVVEETVDTAVEETVAETAEAVEDTVDENELQFVVIDDNLDNVEANEAVDDRDYSVKESDPKATKKKKKKKSAGNIIFTICNTIILTVFTIVTLYPILNTLAISFNDGIDALRGGIYLWPRVFSLKNYQTVLNMEDLVTGAQNSVLRTLIGTVLQVSTTALLAYVLSIKDFLFGKSVSFFYVITMYLGAGLIPTFLWFRELHLINTFAVYVVPGIISAFNLLVLRTYMKDIPESLRESAQLDGASHMKVFFKIYLPLSKPVLATVALFVAVGHWSSWFDNMIYNRTNDDLTTLQYELMKLLSSVSSQTSGGSAYTNNTEQAAQITPTSI